MTDELTRAVEVALATGRPLLLRGEPGSGKSSLAPFFAQREGWRFCKHVVTARTQAQDLLWNFDSVRRLADARSRQVDGEPWQDFRYVEPGPLWWAFAPGSARRRGSTLSELMPPELYAADPRWKENETRRQDRAVLLIDEIDKADPDLPNSLLVPLGTGEFQVAETRRTVAKEPASPESGDLSSFVRPGFAHHLVVVTTNEERELPQAFLRRCVVTWLSEPSVTRLVEIALAHQEKRSGGVGADDEVLATALANALDEARADAKSKARRPPSTAEFLDAFRACRELEIRPHSEGWHHVEQLTLRKTRPDDAR
ncbi:AAA family ATPase [Lentzea sp. NPDC058450]|uniref:AAA family ATPase n=1 Tax=Lentzea sp. NPDC058450 TaxID=3346505 RepID=UPI00364F2F71